MKITTQAQARKMGATITKLDGGKYAPMPAEFVGREIPDYKEVLAVYAVSKKDRHGRYTALMAVSK